jgi:hypothetical protein
MFSLLHWITQFNLWNVKRFVETQKFSNILLTGTSKLVKKGHYYKRSFSKRNELEENNSRLLQLAMTKADLNKSQQSVE